jgi:hypothetical protein
MEGMLVERNQQQQQQQANLEESSPPSASEVKERVLAVYETLSNRDSFEIFVLASFGIDASTTTWHNHGFSKKRYYQRLKRLVDIGLVQKEKGQYKQSPLGKLIYENQVKQLQTVLAGMKFSDPETEVILQQ